MAHPPITKAELEKHVDDSIVPIQTVQFSFRDECRFVRQMEIIHAARQTDGFGVYRDDDGEFHIIRPKDVDPAAVDLN